MQISFQKSPAEFGSSVVSFSDRPFTCSFITGGRQSHSSTGLIGPWLEKRAQICTPNMLNWALFTHSGVGGPAPCHLWWCLTLEVWQVDWDFARSITFYFFFSSSESLWLLGVDRRSFFLSCIFICSKDFKEKKCMYNTILLYFEAFFGGSASWQSLICHFKISFLPDESIFYFFLLFENVPQQTNTACHEGNLYSLNTPNLCPCKG